MTRAGAVYGLPEEYTQLESDDEEFFGYDPESESECETVESEYCPPDSTVSRDSIH